MASTSREAPAQAFEKRSSRRISRESPLKEELSYPVSPLIGRSRSSQLISSEGLKGYGRGSPREEICRELFQCIRRSEAC